MPETELPAASGGIPREVGVRPVDGPTEVAVEHAAAEARSGRFDDPVPDEAPPALLEPVDLVHFVADHDESSLGEVDALDESVPPASLWREAGRKLVRRPLFIVSALMIVVILAVTIAPGVFTTGSLTECLLSRRFGPPEAGHPFGFDQQGCDVFARIVYGARPSVLVGVLSMLVVLLVGGTVGALAGWRGGWLDAVFSRLGDIFYAIPTVLAALVFLNSQRDKAPSVMVFLVVGVIAAFAWPQMARMTRGSVLSVKSSDFVTASRAIGVTNRRILIRHIVPNAAAPMIVTATVSLGTYIVLEATLSFLGLGLPITMRSWGQQISSNQGMVRTHPEQLFYPGAALALTVLAFIMLGDAVRDALDPKAAR
ncbi:MAG: ABC transporter permease [Propionibacteriaceae bacterium]|nr:ABC transporter permease [Propionibacteriaceae bacterium]